MQQTRIPFPRGRNPIELISAAELLKALPAPARVRRGILHLFVRGAGAALSVNENCDPAVRSDLHNSLLRLLPDGAAPSPAQAADARALLLSTSLAVPVASGSAGFGTWQGIYVARMRPDAEGELVVTLVETAASQAGFTFNANRRQSHLIDAEVSSAVAAAGPADVSGAGMLLVHEKHTSASLSLAGLDLEPAMREVVPERWNQEFFEHTDEGPDDMPGHVKSSLLGCSLVVPTEAGRPVLGEEQRLTLNEHRNAGGWGGGHSRQVQITPLVGGLRRDIEVPNPGGTALTDVTGAVQGAVVGALGPASGPGLALVFAPREVCGIIAATCPAAQTFASGLANLTPDPRARAAIAKNGLLIPFDARGELLLADGQNIWLYDAVASASPMGASSVDADRSSKLLVILHANKSEGVASSGL